MSIREFNKQIGSFGRQSAWAQALRDHNPAQWPERKEVLKDSWPIWWDGMGGGTGG